MRFALVFRALVSVILAAGVPSIQADPPLPAQASLLQRQRPPVPIPGVHKTQITPHWFQNNTRFWYRNDLARGTREFIVVDAAQGKRERAFDHQKLAVGLNKASGGDYQADRLPLDTLEWSRDGKTLRFTVRGTTWQCDLATYECKKSERGIVLPKETVQEQAAEPKERARLESPWPETRAPFVEELPGEEVAQRPRFPQESARSPDGKWTCFIKNHNVTIRARDGDKEIQLSTDGKEGLAYDMPRWAPDSKTVVAFRVQPGERKEVYLIESSPRGGGRARLHTRPYPLPGDRFTTYELHLFEVATQKPIKAEVEPIDFGFPRVRWHKDGRHFTYSKTDRGHQRFRLIEVDSHTGKARNLIDEKTETFIWSAHMDGLNLNAVTWLGGDNEILYISERDGWRHLYLMDAKTGKLKNRITQGEYVVRGIDRIDEEKRQIWFRASGKNPDQDPYLIHFYRVNFDGSNLVALAEGDGNHTIQYSPDRKYLIDTYSRVNLAPVHELRRTEDGKLVCALEQADITELKQSGWEAPEVFTAKGRDGKTAIWGIICRPRTFDPRKKYPVIEYIYAGPQGSFVPKTFSAARRFASLTDLGFIVVQIDGMGTANRSKAFHDVCWKNLKDGGFPDRILWHKAVAQKYPSYDLSRVGIYGGSAGGQNAMAAVLFHPDFYKAAVAGCGCHDNRMDKASWNEQWMGYPVGPHYAACSNVDNAYRLKGKLLLIVGEMDNNVPPESTLRVVDALIKAGKDFDLLVVPGAGHGMGGAYGDRRLRDFFVRHLQGVEPPDRNGERGRSE